MYLTTYKISQLDLIFLNWVDQIRERIYLLILELNYLLLKEWKKREISQIDLHKKLENALKDYSLNQLNKLE